jgi:hypothetical protein
MACLKPRHTTHALPHAPGCAAPFRSERALIRLSSVPFESHPVFQPLFLDIKQKINLKLTRTKPLASGVIILYYEKAAA